MKNLIASLLVLAAVACKGSVASSSESQKQSASYSTLAAAQAEQTDSKEFSSFFIKGDRLSYNGFDVILLNKTIREKDYPKVDIPVTYAVLKKAGHVLMTFDGVYFGAGNATAFGLASLLGGEGKQLLVSQTVPRGGRHWIVDLSSYPAVLFDSGDYEIGGEDVALSDEGKDGVYELGLSVDKFWLIGGMPMAGRPQPHMTFKFDPISRKYLPSVSTSGRELAEIDEDAKAIDPEEKPKETASGLYVARRLDVLLRYVYAGGREKGWAFFQRAYNLTDKPEIETQVRERLESDPVYKYIYGLR